MTDQPPAGRPEFTPPAGAPDATPPAPGGWQPPGGPQAFVPPPSGVGAGGTVPPGPPPQGAFVPPGQEPWRQAPPRGGRGSILLGLGITFASAGAAWAATLWAGHDSALYALANAVWFLPVILLVAGIVLAAIPRTTRTGAGILLGIGATILVLGGLCIALIAGYGQ